MPELEEERQFLMRSLDDLEDERASGDIAEKDYVELRDAYARRVAEVSQAISAGSSGADDEFDDMPVDRRRRRMNRTIAAVVLVALVAGGAGALVATMAGERTAGQQVSGSLSGGAAERLSQARSLMGQGKALEAIKLFDSVLNDDPANAEALAYRGWLLKLAGLWERGLESVDKAIAADPSYPDAHFFRGMILEQDKADHAGAVVELRTFLAANPTGDLVPMVEQVLERATKAAEDAGQPIPTAPSPPDQQAS